MTPRQAETLDFIKGYIAEHGYSPSYNDVMGGLGVSSKSVVHWLLKKLERDGHISLGYAQARSIRIAERCPHCGEYL